MLSNQPVWTSSDNAVASVLSDGSVTAQRVGSTVATCQIGGRSATSMITVSTATIAFVEVSPGAGTIATGTSLQFSGVPRDSLGFPVPGSDVQWASADTSVATVSQAGFVTAKLSGEATIFATSAGVAGMTKVKVTPTPPPPVASITLSVDQTSLAAGRSTHATATAYDANGQVLSGRSITWSTSNPSVLSAVTLNATRATVSGLSPGSAAVTATSEGQSASVTVTVGSPSVAIVVTSLASPSIYIGQTTLASAIPEDGFGHPLTGHTVTWSSLDPTIATVSSSGVVTGVSAGAVIIRATSDGVTGDASLTVTSAPVASVSASLASTTLNPGQTTQGTAIAYDASGNVLTGRSIAWSSLNTSIATVSIAGLVTAVAPGSVAIRATIESKAASVTLVVNAPTTTAPGTTASIVVTFDSSSIAVGHTSQGKAVAKDAQGNVLTGKTPSWVSTTGGIAAVSSTGVVTGLSAGTPVIQATIDGVVGQGSLAVTGSSTTTSGTTASVLVTFDSASIAVGHMSQAKAIAKDAQGNVLAGKTAAWLSKTTGIASVSNTGVVTGLSGGTATIQATIDGINGTGSLTVTGGSVITAPTPSGSISANFEDGTYGPFYNAWGSGIDLIDDPTGNGHGKIARMHYANAPSAGNYDSNLGLYPVADWSATFGQTRYVKGDLYIPHPPAGTELQQRKILVAYGQPNSGDGGLLTAWGQDGSTAHSQLNFAFGSGGAKAPLYTEYGLAILTWDAWHTIELQYTIESSPGATNGIARVWLDGQLVDQHTNLTWIAPGFTQIGGAGFGYQYNSTITTNEYRYWDNIAISATPFGGEGTVTPNRIPRPTLPAPASPTTPDRKR